MIARRLKLFVYSRVSIWPAQKEIIEGEVHVDLRAPGSNETASTRARVLNYLATRLFGYLATYLRVPAVQR